MNKIQSWVGENEWLGATPWLLFLGFPLFSVWADDFSVTAKIAATVALAAFAAVYVHGFFAAHRHAAAGGSPDQWIDGWWHLAAMIACLAFAYVVTGVGVLPALPFVVTLAVFTRTWPQIAVIFALAMGVAIGVPWAVDNVVGGVLTGALVLCIGVATVAIRIFDERAIVEQRLKTEVAVISERERVGRDVHDVIGHNLTATIVKVELARALLDGVEASSDAGAARLERSRAELADLEAVSRRSLAEIRATVSGLRTADLDDELNSARAVLADAGVELTVVGDRQGPQGAAREALAWTVREGVTNVVRHARATTCLIQLAPSDGVALTLSDDGVGLEENGNGDGNGLSGLRTRLASADLTLRIESIPPRGGTVLTVEEVDP